MDRQDLKILQALSENARISGASIARRVNLSLPAVTSRLRKLDASGMIDKYTVRLNREKMDLKLLAFIQVWINHGKGENIKQQIVDLPEVLEVHHAAGDYDLLLKVLVKDTDTLERFLVEKLKTIKTVARTSTTIILSTYKEELNPKALS